MLWVTAAITAYFINAGIYISDKYFLSKKVHSSIVYAFFVGLWSIFNAVILFFDPWVPTMRECALDFLAGGLFLVTLVFWYKALHQSQATVVVPVVGALVPIFSFVFSYIFLNESLGETEFLAFIILVIGGILVSVKQKRWFAIKEWYSKFRQTFGDSIGGIHASYRPTSRLVLNSVTSSLFFSLYYVLIKYIYMTQPFIGGFVWSRFGSFLAVLIMLLVPDWRKMIAGNRKEVEKPKNIILFVAVRLLAGVAFIMLNWAISMGNVALVNSLQGAQYVFLIFLVLFLSAKFPKILKEEMKGAVLLYKALGIVLIGVGLYMLVS